MKYLFFCLFHTFFFIEVRGQKPELFINLFKTAKDFKYVVKQTFPDPHKMGWHIQSDILSAVLPFQTKEFRSGTVCQISGIQDNQSTQVNRHADYLRGTVNNWNHWFSKTAGANGAVNQGDKHFKSKAPELYDAKDSAVEKVKVKPEPAIWQTYWFKVLAVAFFTVLTGFAWYLYRRNLHKQKISLENLFRERIGELELENNALKEKMKEIGSQEELFLLMLKDLNDNIKAAQVIQESMIPSEDQIRKHVSDLFIFNHPKDQVGGDFYWFCEYNGKNLFAVCDCTGHGISGAFMSIIAVHLLNQITSLKSNLSAAEILKELHTYITRELHQREGTNIQDGLDIALCIWDKKTLHLQFAGAGIPLYILSNSSLVQVPPDRLPIGLDLKKAGRTFVNKDCVLQSGDILYMFSDGYADQIGGEGEGKKFNYVNFRELLTNICNNPLHVQKSILFGTLLNWIGPNHSQLDDVLVVGIKV